MRYNYGNTDYDRLRRMGEKYEDYILPILSEQFNWNLNVYETRKDQFEKGETYFYGLNAWGTEIKRDGNFRKTGNVYLEFAENGSRRGWCDSGILKDDNSIFFVIGDENNFWVFEVDVLLDEVYNNENFRTVANKTSKGILLPIKDANYYALRRGRIKNGKVEIKKGEYYNGEACHDGTLPHRLGLKAY